MAEDSEEFHVTTYNHRECPLYKLRHVGIDIDNAVIIKVL